MSRAPTSSPTKTVRLGATAIILFFTYSYSCCLYSVISMTYKNNRFVIFMKSLSIYEIHPYSSICKVHDWKNILQYKCFHSSWNKFLNFFNDSYFLSETFHIKELVFCHFIKDATDYCNRCPYVLGSQSQIYSDISCPHKQSDDQNIDTSLTVTMKLQELKTWINHHRERKRLSQRSCTIKLKLW